MQGDALALEHFGYRRINLGHPGLKSPYILLLNDSMWIQFSMKTGLQVIASCLVIFCETSRWKLHGAKQKQTEGSHMKKGWQTIFL